MEHLMTTELWNRCAAKIRHLLWTQQWYILYRYGEESEDYRLEQFAPVPPPRRTLWADPFVVEHENRIFVFFEEQSYRFWGRSSGSRGRLCVMEFFEDGRWSPPSPVLTRDYHLSYPFVFSYGGRHYLIPETVANHSIELYQSVEFPYRWELCRTVMTGLEAVDTTLCQHDGKWWMFTCTGDPVCGANSALHVFSSTDPVAGEWIPHAANPVVRDAGCARPAGRIFERWGALYRPAQDCSREYGAAIELRKITRLTETQYEEVPIRRISAAGVRGAEGVHTWNHAGGLTVADARRRVGRWRLC
jgi:hypothetical protein